MKQDRRCTLGLWTFIYLFALASATDGHPTEMKSHSPDAPMVADADLPERRVKRGTSGSRLTYEERLDFLRAHNDFRANTDPVASDMEFTVWHEELAAMAQEWADGCEWKHGNPERDPKPFPAIGQNLYMTTAQSVDGRTVTTSWYNEVKDYSYSSNSCAENKVCGHYTQVVWANSDNVGCAKTACDELSGLNAKNAIFVVCNYGPAGNYVGKRPYATGPKCSSCPEDKPSCENGLCVSDPKCGDKSCENGGTLDTVSCECVCVDGYNGDTCTSTCHLTRPIRMLYAFTCLLIVVMINQMY